MFDIIDYDCRKYDFNRVIRELFNVHDLARLHEIVEYEMFKRETDQKTIWHKKYYATFEDPNSPFVETYTRFVHEFIAPLYDEEIIYQTRPTFRTHFPNNIGVGEFHRDRDYNHSMHEVNFLLTLTPMYDTNSVWIETADGSNQFEAPSLRCGQVLRFNGANLLHGNKTNETGQTRVSFDFRVKPLLKHERTDKTTINTSFKFDIGGYWSKLDAARV